MNVAQIHAATMEYVPYLPELPAHHINAHVSPDTQVLIVKVEFLILVCPARALMEAYARATQTPAIISARVCLALVASIAHM